MSTQFDVRKAKPQKANSLVVSGLLRRSHARSVTAEHDQNPQNLLNHTQTSQASNFRHDFSQVPVQTASTPPIQLKLQVGQPGDRYEQEADRVADQVTRSVTSATGDRSGGGVPVIGRIQPEWSDPLRRQPAAVDEEKKKVAKEVAHNAEKKKQEAEKEKVAAEEKAVKADKDKHDKDKKKKEDDPLQTRAEPGQMPVVTPALETHLNTRQSGGQPLPEPTRMTMESRFHHDFSQVRVHTDSQATQALNARAFTRKHSIFFNPTQYQPETLAGQRLLAHELTHVVQQGAAPLKPKTPWAKS